MVSACADHTNIDAVTLIPAGKPINDIDAVSGVEIVDCTLTVDSPDLYKPN